MKIELHRMRVGDVMAEYLDRGEEGVTAYNGLLNIRPKYQREFVYKEKQRDEVIRTVRQGFPLNVMYWMKNDNDGFEVLDGQQRTISIGQYLNSDFSIDDRYFHNLLPQEKEQILDYELMIYHCEGDDLERLSWFEIINIAGEELTKQELRNAVYTGPWLSDAKLKFSKNNCAAYLLANDRGALMTGSTIRQEYLQTALSWINHGEIRDYMAKHQHDENANALWQYFQKVIHWTRTTFPNYRREMRTVAWGDLYNQFGDATLDPVKVETEVSRLMADEDVTKKSGIYPYVLNHKLSELSLRAFNDRQKREAYERQGGLCDSCKKPFDISLMEADHITPWVEGGKTVEANCQMLCRECNRRKGSR